MEKCIPMCPWPVKNAVEPRRTAAHSGQPRRKPPNPSSKQARQTYNNGRGSTMWARKNKHNPAASRGVDAPADPKSTSAHMPPQMRRKDDQIKNGIATYSKEAALTRAHRASLQIDDHTQDASLRYRHRHTDPQNFSSLGFIRAPQIQGV
jgi:hypothetical protein